MCESVSCIFIVVFNKFHGLFSPGRYKFRDIELKFCICFSNFYTLDEPPNVITNGKHFLYTTFLRKIMFLINMIIRAKKVCFQIVNEVMVVVIVILYNNDDSG